MNLIQWKNNFLSKNLRLDLKGIPLYAYKVSSEEFLDLKDCLQSNILTYLNFYEINDICKRSSEFPQLFVLYASIWWQREYDGTGMAWEPILKSIGIDTHSLDSNIRSQAIKAGFKQWGLELNKDIGNLKFIGNIASQGGLPLKLIATGHGNLNRLLNRVLKDVVNLAFPDAQNVQNIIESHKNELPKSYRQKEIFSLLAEIIITFLELKNDAKLDAGSNAIEKLNGFDMHWRDRFPLPMDDENARGVLERFIKDGIKVKAEAQKFTLTLERYISIDGERAALVSQLNLPKQNIDEDSIKKCFGVDDNFLTRVMTLVIRSHQHSDEITIRRIAGQANYKFDFDTNPRFRNAHSEHFATLKNSNNEIKLIELTGGYELDQDAPWIFDVKDDDQYNFLKVGSGKFKSNKLLIVVPSNFFTTDTYESKFDIEGSNDRICYLVSNEITFTHNEDQYNIRPQYQNVIEEEFVLVGERIWDIFQRPTSAYKGAPHVYKWIHQTPTLKNQVLVNANCRNLGDQILEDQLKTFGPLNLVVKDTNNISWASTIAILPKQANFKIIPSKESHRGSIRLESWQINNLKCLTKNVEIEVYQDGVIDNIDCSYVGTETPEEYIEFELFWNANPKSAIIRFPFPSLGVIAFDSTGKQIGHNKSLSIHKLHGVRVVTLLHQSNFVEAELSLKDNGSARSTIISRQIKRGQANSRLEISPIDFKEDISVLLYSADQLDARVEFRIKVPGARDFVINVTKYDIEFEHNSNNFMIKQSQLSSFSNEEIEKCEVFATRIDELDDVIQLKQSGSSGVANGIWEFPVLSHPQGCWMIYPSLNSSIQFRPMMLERNNTSNGLIELVDLSLKDALKITDSSIRTQNIKTIISNLVEDFNHKDWEHIEYLAEHLGHLNLTSLDLWRLFAKDKQAMAALAIRNSKFPDQFIQRFATELPFLWEFISLDNWLDAAYFLKKQLLQKHDDESFAQKYFEYLLPLKLNALLVAHPSLNMMFEIIKTKNGVQINQEMQGILKHSQAFEMVLLGQLFDGADSEIQKLLRRDNVEWPNKFLTEIRALKRSEHKELMCSSDYSFKDTVINLPIAMAIKSLINRQESWLDDEINYLDIKNIKNFDPDWFATAFDKTIARAITKGYVHL